MRRLLSTMIAVAAVSMPALGASAATRAAGAPDRPVPDADYVYSQLNLMSSTYLQRYSGQDGPPGDLKLQDGNLPPQVNGWQEFYQHWRSQMTDPGPAGAMGSFARFIHYDDHLFRAPTSDLLGVTPPPRNDSDAATVTIVGATCPGQVVLVAAHPDSTPGLNVGNGSSYDDTSGVTMGIGELRAMVQWWRASGTWPARTLKVGLFDAEETGLFGSQYYASSILPPGPQGRYILVANMDQNGMEYPAYPAGSTTTTFGAHPWYTNINASPIKDFSIYSGADGKPLPAILANMPAILHFRAALTQEVRTAFALLGTKYGFSMPLENPLELGATVPAYLPADVAAHSPVQDDTLGRTDQVPFVAAGIPGYGVLGAFDSNATDNPLASPGTPLTPIGASGLPQLAGYDTPRDDMAHLNLMASGTIGGVGSATGAVALRRALELPMTWSTGLLARPEYVGRTPTPSGPVAWFEALPNLPKAGAPVQFNAGPSEDLAGRGLTYAWDFGDGARAAGPTPSHAFAHDGWHNVTLAVRDAAGAVSGYHQEIKVGSPAGAPASTDPCGTVTTQQATTVAGPVTPISTPTGTTPNTAAAAASVDAGLLPAIAVLVGVGVHGRRRRSVERVTARRAAEAPGLDSEACRSAISASTSPTSRPRGPTTTS